jgi:hypothetical protein
MKKKEDFSQRLSPMEALFRQVTTPPPPSKDRFLKAYASLFKAGQDFSEVIKALKYFEKEETIPLDTLKALSSKLDAIIASLGSITLTLETKCDEVSLVAELTQKLHLQEPSQVAFLETRIQKFAASITRSFRDKHLASSLDYQKEKAWRLLESLDTYAKSVYKQSIF